MSTNIQYWRTLAYFSVLFSQMLHHPKNANLLDYRHVAGDMDSFALSIYLTFFHHEITPRNQFHYMARSYLLCIEKYQHYANTSNHSNSTSNIFLRLLMNSFIMI